MDGKVGNAISGVAASMIAISTSAVVLRCWSVVRLRSQRFGWDDYLAILTLPFIIALSSLALWQTSIIQEQRLSETKITRQSKVPEILFSIQYLYEFGIALPRFSVLFFYYGVFRRTSQWFFNTLRCLGILNVCWLLIHLTVTTFQCWPVRSIYDPSVHGHCINRWGWNVGLLSTSLIIDAAILVAPIPLIWKLNAPLTKRLSVASIFLCGFCVLVISMGRLVAVVENRNAALFNSFARNLSSTIWTLLEAPISIVSISLPRIFHLFKHASKHGIQSIVTTQPQSRMSNLTSQTTSPTRPPLAHRATSDSARSEFTPIITEDFAAEKFQLVTKPHIALCHHSPLSARGFDFDIDDAINNPASPNEIYITRDFTVWRGHDV